MNKNILVNYKVYRLTDDKKQEEDSLRYWASKSIKKKYVSVKKELDWKKLYGLGKGLWKKEDAQGFVNCLREERR